MTVNPSRRTRPAVMVMLLLLLAATALFSASSAHHHRDTTAAVAAESRAGHPQVPELAGEHDHEHGNGWSPRLNQRLRAIMLPMVVGLPPLTARVDPPGAADTARADVVLSRLGLLRI
ncbi:hypothetical protein [Actinoplanes italicus]|uniref:Secreted protein n=1 Tax=Actinoplanes italicus TaxID=113567 RepID=A0A2T0KEM3_9ACTN|nr:hypothetical protein [Actinoplanes italicus]PRX21839.1 hypothetical protein CLV67_10516 [Actinoplanes italicus]